jgi:hypothetical protein
MKGNAFTCLVGKPVGRRLLGRPRRRGKDNINVDGRVWAALIWLRI